MSNALITDVSFYEDDEETPRHIDFNKMKSAGVVATIVRAGQKNWPDKSFTQSWKDAKAAGLPRGSYWFLDSRATAKDQARMYFDMLAGDFGELPLFADFEAIKDVPNTTAVQLRDFIEEVRRLIPGKEIVIYTGYYYWLENVPTNMYAYFSQFECWIAAYNNVGPKVPAPWAKWLFWQFTDLGDPAKYGTEGKVDLNYFNGDAEAFKIRFNITDGPTIPPVNTDKVRHTHEGVTLHEITRYGAKCFVHVIDTSLARIEISECGFRTPGFAVDKYNAQVVSNGGGWPNLQDANHRSNEMWVSNGVFKQQVAYIKDNRPYINISENGVIWVQPNAEKIAELYNAVGFDRLLLWNGQFNTKISDRVTKDARTGSGVTADGKFVLLSVEGNDRFNRGLTFPEMAEVMREFGVINGGNNDGGSSSSVRNTAISDEPLFKGSDGAEAPVINHIMVFATPTNEEEPPVDPDPTGDNKMKYKVKKPARFRTLPTTDTNDQGASSIVDDVFESPSPTRPDTKVPGIIMVQHSNLKWLPLKIGTVEYTQALDPDNDPDPEPEPDTDTFSVTLKDDKTGEVWTGTLRKQ